MEDGNETPDFGEKIAAQSDLQSNAWQQTLEDMWALEEELENEGWNTLSIQSGHTAPEPQGVGDYPDRFGLVFVVPGNKEEAFEEAFEEGGYPRYDVFRNKVGDRIYLVVQYLDPDSENAILIAGNYSVRHAAGLAKNVREEEVIYTHVQKLDKTHLGSFKHQEYEKFIPDTELIESYQRDTNIPDEAEVKIDEDSDEE